VFLWHPVPETSSIKLAHHVGCFSYLQAEAEPSSETLCLKKLHVGQCPLCGNNVTQGQARDSKVRQGQTCGKKETQAQTCVKETQ
jgi:hypothetical protein